MSAFGDISNGAGERLDYTVHPGTGHSNQLVLIGHGVTGNKDRPIVVAVAEAIARLGIPALRFSFAGNGESGGKFEDCTISKEVDDLGAILDAVGNETSVVYIGHSMGGAVGTLRAARDPRIKALVSLAGMVHTRAFSEREFGMETPGEGCMWEEPSCPLSQTYVDDMAAIESVADKAAAIRVPWLFVHGTEDDVVPIQDTHDVLAKSTENKTFLKVEGADHVFSGEHQPTTATSVADWIKKTFQGLS